MSTVVPPPLGSGCGGHTGASVDHTRHLRLARGAHQVRVNISGVGQQVGVPGEGVGRGHGLQELRGAVLTAFGGEGQERLCVPLKLLLLLLLLTVPLHLSNQRVPLTFGHPSELHR